MTEAGKIWIVTYNPATNQFDIRRVWDSIIGNYEAIFEDRKDIAQHDRWLTVFMHDDYNECQLFISMVTTIFKSRKPPLELLNTAIGTWNFGKN